MIRQVTRYHRTRPENRTAFEIPPRPVNHKQAKNIAKHADKFGTRWKGRDIMADGRTRDSTAIVVTAPTVFFLGRMNEPIIFVKMK